MHLVTRLRITPALAGLLLALAAALPVAARAADLAEPAGPVLLTVTGAIEETNTPAGAVFDDAMLAALPQVSFTTTTIWTKDREVAFTGPTLASVLDAVGATGDVVMARAINDYIVEFDRADLTQEAPIVARLIDGAPFGIRENGPLWVVYPYDTAPEYRTELVFARSIWQLVELTVEAE